MSFRPRLVAGLRVLFHKHQAERDIDDEVHHYAEMAAQHHIRTGMPRAEAERLARIELGGIEPTKERLRSAGWGSFVESVARDARGALRGLRRSPGFAFTAILTLGAGMGLTTSVLTGANTVLGERWAVPNADRLALLVSARGGADFSPAEARYFAGNATTVTDVVVVRCVGGMSSECRLETSAGVASVDLVSGNYFRALGLRFTAGRGFAPDEDVLANPRPVVVISDAMWRNRFASDAGAVGKQIRIDDVAFTIIGVAPPAFTGTRMEQKDLWLPLSALILLRPEQAAVRAQLTDPSSDHSDAAVAALIAPDVPRERAEAELRTLNARFRLEHRLEDRGLRFIPTSLFPNPAKLRVARNMFALMMTGAVLVLLLACANVGNLLLARCTARGREIAARLALGASRGRVVRQLLTESVLLAALAGLFGLALSVWLPGFLMMRFGGPVSWHFVPDARVLAGASGLVALTCVAFGLAPALSAARTDVAEVLKASDSRAASSRFGVRSGLLALQVAISLALLMITGVVTLGVRHGLHHDLGFRTKGVTTIAAVLPASYVPARRAAFTHQLIEATAAQGASAVAVAGSVPLDRGRAARFHLPADAPLQERVMSAVDVSPGYPAVLEIPFVAGRDLRPGETDAILVNEAAARVLWPDDRPLGKTILDTIERRVVGVIRDANVSRMEWIEPMVFYPTNGAATPVVLIRDGSPERARAITTLAERIDPRVRTDVDSVAGNLNRQLDGLRTTATLAGILGAVALLIASVGAFGVFAYVVQQRRREIGIRMALGCPPAHAVALVVKDSARAMAVGLVVGFMAGAGGARLLGNELYGASALDPVLVAAIAAVLMSAGLAASYVPARAAIRIDPVTALRHD